MSCFRLNVVVNARLPATPEEKIPGNRTCHSAFFYLFPATFLDKLFLCTPQSVCQNAKAPNFAVYNFVRGFFFFLSEACSSNKAAVFFSIGSSSLNKSDPNRQCPSITCLYLVMNNVKIAVNAITGKESLIRAQNIGRNL